MKSASRHQVSERARSLARAMRRKPTEAEIALWRLLRDRRLSAMKWRRQFPLGAFIVDFVCLEHRLVVECDGSQHAENAHDEARDAGCTRKGFKSRGSGITRF